MLENTNNPNIKPHSRIVVGMSGGVDSSVTAALLKEAGFDVIGLFMKNWEEEDENGVCTQEKDYNDVVRVSNALNIPFYTVNFAKEYKERVFSYFLDELKKGNTPNPDILCNREIKFKLLLQAALNLGASGLATGHYAKNVWDNGIFHLQCSDDVTKDQTYFLYTLQQDALAHTLFPLGTIQKTQVRAIARTLGLSTAEKKDSTGICFIGERNFKKFLEGFIGYTPGPMMTYDGKVVKEHDGVSYYTIGQRKGLGIGGPGDAWFVVGKDVAKNVLFVAQGENHPALFADGLIADEVTWVSNPPSSFPFTCTAKIRYRQRDQECQIEPISSTQYSVTFKEPQRAITVKQSIVFYKDRECLGGGVIIQSDPSYYHRGLSHLK